jgi:hypothetical protein
LFLVLAATAGRFQLCCCFRRLGLAQILVGQCGVAGRPMHDEGNAWEAAIATDGMAGH